MAPVRLLVPLLAWIGFANSVVSKPVDPIHVYPGDDSLRIGLVLSGDPGAQSAFESVRRSAILAIEEANDRGGHLGEYFQLILRSNDGPWGSGATRITELVFDHGVAALVGSMDGRGAHLAEQIVTKARVAYVESWATEATVTQAYVPWVFRCVPNDKQQAEALVREIFEERKLTRVATLRSTSYDDRLAERTFAAMAERYGAKTLVRLVDEEPGQAVVNGLSEPRVQAVVLFVPPGRVDELVNSIREIQHISVVFGQLGLAGKTPLDSTLSRPEIALVSSGQPKSAAGAGFAKRYATRWGQQPGWRAAYAYDAVSLVIETIRNVGSDRSAIREALSSIEFQGATGSIRFDDRGNRVGLPGVIEVSAANAAR